MAEQTKDELRAMADELAGEGMPAVAPEATKDELRAAIDAFKAGQPVASEPDGPSSRTFKVTGPYRVFDKRQGQTFTGAVKVNDDTGGEIIVVGNEWANLQALLDMGWLEEVTS